MVRFEIETWVSAPAEVVYDKSLDVDLHANSMTDFQEEAVAGVTTGRMGAGDEVTWKAKHFGITWRMTSRIAEAERPISFIDQQVRGPFSSFRHEHVFETEAGRTKMIDRVEFTAPMGPLGRLAELFVLRRHLERLIELRNQSIKEACES